MENAIQDFAVRMAYAAGKVGMITNVIKALERVKVIIVVLPQSLLEYNTNWLFRCASLFKNRLVVELRSEFYAIIRFM